MFCDTQGLTLTLGGKTFGELLSCAALEPNPIFIVALVNVHPKEVNVRKMPKYNQFYVLILLFQETPHILLLFSNTHMNLHLDKITKYMEYGVSQRQKHPSTIS